MLLLLCLYFLCVFVWVCARMFVCVCVFFESFVLRPKEFSLLFSLLFVSFQLKEESLCVCVCSRALFFFFFWNFLWDIFFWDKGALFFFFFFFFFFFQRGWDCALVCWFVIQDEHHHLSSSFIFLSHIVVWSAHECAPVLLLICFWRRDSLLSSLSRM